LRSVAMPARSPPPPVRFGGQTGSTDPGTARRDRETGTGTFARASAQRPASSRHRRTGSPRNSWAGLRQPRWISKRASRTSNSGGIGRTAQARIGTDKGSQIQLGNDLSEPAGAMIGREVELDFEPAVRRGRPGGRDPARSGRVVGEEPQLSHGECLWEPTLRGITTQGDSGGPKTQVPSGKFTQVPHSSAKAGRSRGTVVTVQEGKRGHH